MFLWKDLICTFLHHGLSHSTCDQLKKEHRHESVIWIIVDDYILHFSELTWTSCLMVLHRTNIQLLLNLPHASIISLSIICYQSLVTKGKDLPRSSIHYWLKVGFPLYCQICMRSLDGNVTSLPDSVLCTTSQSLLDYSPSKGCFFQKGLDSVQMLCKE